MRKHIADSAGNRSRCGLTLAEFLVSLFVIVVIFAIALPSIRTAREAARETHCRNQLREIGIALYTWSNSDSKGRFCSGDYNFMADGDPSKYSWVGNFLDVNGDPRNLNCPSSSVVAGATVQEMLGRAEQPSGDFPPPEQRDGVLFTRLIDPLTGKDRLVASTERDGIVRKALKDGLYSNYRASWFLVRGELLIDYRLSEEPSTAAGPSGVVHPLGCNRPWSGSGSNLSCGKATCTGPMTHARSSQLLIPMSCIPWLSEAGLAHGRSIRLRLDPPADSLDTARRLTEGASLYSHGNWGPAYFADGRLCHLNDGFSGAETFSVADLEVSNGDEVNQVPGSHAEGPGSRRGPMILQDTRSWRPAHGPRSCVLMGDGSVRTLTDLNGDGYFNPGFVVSMDQTASGYQRGPCELAKWECFSGALLFKPHSLTAADEVR